MKKTIVFISVFLVMALSVSAFADDIVYSEGRLYYKVNGESVSIVGSFEENETVEIPASIDGLPVNTIASGAFSDNKYIKILRLPDTIMTIEPGAIKAGIDVVYNANIEPKSEPTPTVAPTPAAASTPTAAPTPAASSTPTAAPTPAATSASDTPTVTQYTGSVHSADVVLDEEGDVKYEIKGPDPTPTPTPEPTPEPTPVPTEEPAPEPTEAPSTEEAPEQSKNNTAVIIIAAAAAAALCAFAVLKKKK